MTADENPDFCGKYGRLGDCKRIFLLEFFDERI